MHHPSSLIAATTMAPQLIAILLLTFIPEARSENMARITFLYYKVG
jgi:hypothetical protein